ncbi:MAG: hypothetical protein J6P60_02720 [Lachnospiraceae bacterium]|nr:hypothetical protein [Lachnospiraceae bacterium]
MNKRFTRSEFLFFAAYVLWLTFAAIKLTYFKEMFAFSDINEKIGNVALVILLLKFVVDDRYDWRGITGVLVTAVVYYISVHANAPGIWIPVCFVFGARNINYRDILKATMIVQLGVMAATVTCSLIGIIPNELWDEVTRQRYSLGYTFCTYGSHISLFLTLIYLSLRRKINLWEMAFWLCWNGVWYRVTQTRTDLLLCVPFVLLCYLVGKLHLAFHSRKIAQSLYMIIGPLIASAAVAAQWFFDERIPEMRKINIALNSRLKLGHDAITEYGLRAFGQYIRWVGRGSIKHHPDWIYNYVDSSYLKYLLHYGVVFFILLMIGIVLMGKWVADSQNPGLQIAFVVWLLYGAIDAELFELGFQPFMLFLGYAFANSLTQIEFAKSYNIVYDILDKHVCDNRADKHRSGA